MKLLKLSRIELTELKFGIDVLIDCAEENGESGKAAILRGIYAKILTARTIQDDIPLLEQVRDEWQDS